MRVLCLLLVLICYQCFQRVRTADLLIHATPCGWLCWTSWTAWTVTVRARGPKVVTAGGRLISDAFFIPLCVLHPHVFSFCSQLRAGRLSCLLYSNPPCNVLHVATSSSSFRIALRAVMNCPTGSLPCAIVLGCLASLYDDSMGGSCILP